MFQIKEDKGQVLCFHRIISECKLSPEGTENPENPQNLHNGDRTGAEEGKTFTIGNWTQGGGTDIHIKPNTDAAIMKIHVLISI